MYEKVMLTAADMIVAYTSAFTPANVDTPSSARGNKSARGERGSSSVNRPPSGSSGRKHQAVQSQSEKTQRSSGVPSSASAKTTSNVANPLEAISGLWFEATLVLKHTPTNDSDWEHLSNVTKTSQEFLGR